MFTHKKMTIHFGPGLKWGVSSGTEPLYGETTVTLTWSSAESPLGLGAIQVNYGLWSMVEREEFN